MPYKRNRSNIENIKCRPVMSLLQLPLTNKPICLLMTLSEECRTTPVFLILCTILPLPHHIVRPLSTSVAFFLTLWFSDLVPYVLILKTFHVKNKNTNSFPERLNQYKYIEQMDPTNTRNREYRG